MTTALTTHSGIMLVVAVFFLLLVCPCQGFPEQGPDTAAITHEPLEELLNRQEAKWASLLKEQEDKTASMLKEQEDKTTSLLKEQDAKWASMLKEQEDKTVSLLKEQEDKTASMLKKQQDKTASLLKEQEDKTASLLKEQEDKTASLLKEQEAKWASALKEQDTRLTSQLRQQEEKLLAQQDLLRLQAEKLSHQESLLQDQAAKLSSQQTLLQQQDRPIQQLKHSRDLQQTFVEKNLTHSLKSSGKKEETSTFPSHDVMPRSDDAGPLEAVVAHLSQRVTEMGADMQTLKNSQTQQDLAIQDAQSSTFVHWGSSTCTNLSHTVYSGVVGGSWYDHTGAATNYLCLTMSPVFSGHTVPSAKAYLYGGEYQTYDSHLEKDPVCAVCRSTLSTTVMIPGTNVCTPGWHLQYSGFLMAGQMAHPAGSEYICVDSKLENFPSSNEDKNGKLLYYTVTHCGSLPCTPYVNNKVVTCAVCSK